MIADYGVSGIAHASTEGRTYSKREPIFDKVQLAAVRDMPVMPAAVSTVVRSLGLSRQAVHRIAADRA